MINLLDGRNVDPANITFNENTYHFFYGDEDITNLIRRADKNNNWPNFDGATDNLRIQTEGTGTPGRGAFTGKTGIEQPLNDSTLSNFETQITTDPLAAPLESASKAIKTVGGNTLKAIFSTLAGWLIVGGVGLVVYFKFLRK